MINRLCYHDWALKSTLPIQSRALSFWLYCSKMMSIALNIVHLYSPIGRASTVYIVHVYVWSSHVHLYGWLLLECTYMCTKFRFVLPSLFFQFLLRSFSLGGHWYSLWLGSLQSLL